MRKIFTLFLALFCVSSIWAEDVTEEQALEQALSFLTNTPATPGIPRHTSTGTSQLEAAKKVSGLYVFNIRDNGGFVIVSNDDRTRSILGFSDKGNIDTDQMPENMKAWLQGYADEIAWLQKQNKKTASVNRPRNKVGSHSTTAITPLVTCTWNQDAPFNDYCPSYSSWYGGSGKCATGCVATAMAQVMYYHKWPEGQTQPIPGYTTYTQGLVLSSLAPETFDWANMKDNYNGTYTTAQGKAVATLMKYCGYSVQMDYDEASGAYTEDVAIALKTYFDYKSTTKFVSRSSYSYAKWTDLIYHELSQGRPVIYGGMSTGGGHEFVCDGYKFQNNTDFFHINWGWGGTSDNYFVLSALDPDQQGIGGSTSNDGFHYGQDAVIGIQRSIDNGTIADVAPQDYNLVLNSTTLSNNPVSPNTTISVTFNVTNNGTEDYDGDIWLDLIDYEGEEYFYDLNSFVIPAGATKDCVFSFQPTEEGTYILKFCYIDANGEYVFVDDNAATLTVAAANKYVPIYGYYCDEYSRSQFIIPQANIEDMINSSVTGVTFYAEQTSVSWGAAQFDVYLSEVSESTINSLKDWNTLEKVYSGSLSVKNNKMTITFDTPFFYQGGNLLVGINQTTKGSYKDVSWTGEKVTGASLGGYNTSINQQNFLPKTTFDYTQDLLTKPTNLAAEASATEASLSWEGAGDSYVVRYRTAEMTDMSVWKQVGKNVTATNELQTYTFDLSAYSGTGYIAIRHYNISDMFWLNIDDIVVKNAGGTTVLSEDFESGSAPTNWENLDMDEDGNSWFLRDANGDDSNGKPYYNGTYAVSSESYINDFGPLTPDNWLIIPNVELGGTLTLVARGQDPSYAAEVFGIFVTTEAYHVPAGEWVEVTTNETSCLVNNLTPNTTYDWEVMAVTETEESSWASSTFTTEEATPVAVLANNEDNTNLIESLNGKSGYDVQLANRTLYKDGSWNTICLPFDVTIAGSVLDGADIRTLNNATLSGETVTLNFTEEGTVTTLTAGTPYIIRWESSDNIVNPVFTGVTFNKTMNDVACDLGNGKGITFKGTYGYTTFGETDKSILFLGNSNKLYYPLNGARIGAQRAYFKLEGITPVEKVSGIKQFILSFGDDADGINNVNANLNEDWYDLNGRKLAGKPNQKGIYIINGNKTIIK